MNTRPDAHRVYAPETNRPHWPDHEADDAQLLMERGFAVGDAHQSMFSESLASSERILGATNAQRASSPSWMRRDVPSTHFDASHGRGALTRIEKSHNTSLHSAHLLLGVVLCRERKKQRTEHTLLRNPKMQGLMAGYSPHANTVCDRSVINDEIQASAWSANLNSCGSLSSNISWSMQSNAAEMFLLTISAAKLSLFSLCTSLVRAPMKSTYFYLAHNQTSDCQELGDNYK